MNNKCDPFGFNKQTATLLHGLGASELIPECKKMNISIDVLHELSVEELIMLGANYEKANKLWSTLNIKKKKYGIVLTNIEDRIQHFLDIIKQGEHQFSLIQAFVAYCRLRLTKERTNLYIDLNKSLSASEVLSISAKATLIEIEDAKKSLSELEELILRLRTRPKCNSVRRVCTFLGGLGVATLVLFKVYISLT